MPDPLVSVVIPTYNRRRKILHAVQSVLDQTYSAIEVIVSDDASSDGTESVLREFIQRQDRRIRYVRSEANCGVSAARNRGISLARGEYIAFLDSDDSWDPQKIERQVQVAQTLGPHAFVFCGFRLCDQSGEQTIKLLTTDRQEGPCFLSPQENPLEKSLPPAGGWLISSSFVQKVGLFDEKMKTFEDADFAYRIYTAGFKGYFINEPFVRCHSDHHAQDNLSTMSVKTMEAKEYMVKKYGHSGISRRNIARVYNSLAKDYLFYKNRKMGSYSLLRAFLAYPLNLDYLGKAFRAWVWIRERV